MPGQYNPESILEEQFESQRQQIQKQFQFKWNEINNQARNNLFKSPKDHETALHDLYAQNKQMMLEFDQKAEQATGQLQQIDRLAEQGAIQNPDEVKWRMVLGPEAERGMFPPEPRDPRLEHRDILAEENRHFQVIGSFAKGRDGRLYQAKIDSKGDYTDQPDRSKPALQYEVALWFASHEALDVLEQQKLGLVQSMANQGISDPNRLQDRMMTSEAESLLSKFAKGFAKHLHSPKEMRSIYGFAPKPGGTFAQKVQQDIVPPRTKTPSIRAPQAGKKLTKKIAMQYMMQHGNKEDARAAARADGYAE